MPDQQIEDLSDLGANLAAADQFIVNDVSDTTDDAGGSPKRISAANARLYLTGLTIDSEYNAGLGNVAKTLVVGKLTPIDLGANNGGNLAANVVVTLPSANAGDRTGFFITRASNQAGSFAQAPGYGAEIANATRINDSAYTAVSTGTGKWGLWVAGEFLTFLYLDTGYGSGTAGWYVEIDGRSMQAGRMTITTAMTTNIAATWKKCPFDTEDAIFKVAALADTTNNLFKIKRTGGYDCTFGCVPNSGVSDTRYYGVRLYDGTNKIGAFILRNSAATPSSVTGTVRNVMCAFAAGTNVECDFIGDEANVGCSVSDLAGDNILDMVTQFAIAELK
jgi:hypothetical protein